MRCLAHCLVLLMSPMFGVATSAQASDRGGDCVYASPDADRPAPARAAAGVVPPARPAPPQAAGAGSGGGGGDDDVLQRLRAPKWHSFLPGMFR